MSDFLGWQSDLSLEMVFSGSESVSYPQFWHKGLIYLSVLKSETGRSVVMYREGDRHKCLTPAPFSVRTRLSEYGGKPFWLQHGCLYFSNDVDQCIYCQKLDQDIAGWPQRITPRPNDSARQMYVNLVRVTPKFMLAIMEQTSTIPGQDNATSLVAINLQEAADNAVSKLLEGDDFYSNLSFDNKHLRISWVQWNHPDMPWNGTELWVAELAIEAKSIAIINARRIALDDTASICQVYFANNGRLFFSADFFARETDSTENYWNIYAVDFTAREPKVLSVTSEYMEFGYPHWQHGDARIAQFDEETLLTFGSSAIEDVLVRINQDSLQVEKLQPEHEKFTYQNLFADGRGRAAVIRMSEVSPPSIAVMTTEQRTFRAVACPAVVLQPADVSIASHLEYQTVAGDSAYGFYYPATNAKYSVKSGQLPPLIVMVHGGPTARAYGFFDLRKQFWTQRGFAIFDVNHHGSNGYGRAYRDALYGRWGELDTRDVFDGIQYLIEHRLADPRRICIRGKSAGGYAVLCALTQYPDVFRAGASYYGIGNLATLAETTHKFEKHYADRLIGEDYHAATAGLVESAFYRRSPINALEKLRSSMIIFQGLQDEVVPPAVAHEIIAVLKKFGLGYSYVEYADEGHGFRQLANNIDAWSKELEFYRKNLL